MNGSLFLAIESATDGDTIIIKTPTGEETALFKGFADNGDVRTTRGFFVRETCTVLSRI